MKRSLPTIEEFLVNAIFLTSFFIFIPIFPVRLETQPILALFFSLILITLKRDLACRQRDVFYITILVLLITLYSAISYLFSGRNAVIDTLKLLTPIIIYLAVKNHCRSLSAYLLVCISGIYSCLILGGLLDPLLYLSLHQSIMPRVQIYGRLLFLAPEPSYYSYSLMLFVSLGMYLIINNKISHRLFLFLIIPLIIAGVLTSSGLVYLALSIILVSTTFLIRKRKLLLIIVVLISFFSAFPPAGFTRVSNSFKAFTSLLDGGMSFDNYINGAESSGSTRIILNLIGFSGLTENFGIGNGLGRFATSWADKAYQKFDLNLDHHEVLKEKGEVYPQTFLADLAFGVGLFSILFFGVLFNSNIKTSNVSPEKHKVMKSYLFCSFAFIALCMIFQSPISSPVPWLIMALLKKSEFSIGS